MNFFFFDDIPSLKLFFNPHQAAVSGWNGRWLNIYLINTQLFIHIFLCLPLAVLHHSQIVHLLFFFTFYKTF